MIILHLPRRVSRVGMADLRLLLISAVAWALVGCSSASQQTHQGFEYAGRGNRTHYEQSSRVHSKRRLLHGRTMTAKKTNAPHRKHNPLNKIAEPHVVPKMDASSFVRPDHKSNIVTTTPTVPTKSVFRHPLSPTIRQRRRRFRTMRRLRRTFRHPLS